MQTIPTYHFILNYSGDKRNNEYLDKKALIEKVCREAKKLYFQNNNPFYAHLVRKENGIGISCCIKDGNPWFGIFFTNEREIKIDIPYEILLDFTEDDFNLLLYRIEYANQRDLPLQSLYSAWESCIKEQEAALEKEDGLDRE